MNLDSFFQQNLNMQAVEICFAILALFLFIKRIYKKSKRKNLFKRTRLM